MNAQNARDSLRTIQQAQTTASRHSQNNGVVLIVWGVVVVVGMAGFDLFPFMAGRWGGPNAARLWGPPGASLCLTVLALSASIWTKRYVCSLPVQPNAPGNRWLWVRGGKRGRCGTGVWVVWHLLVLAVGIMLAVHIRRVMGLHGPAPFAMTITGLVDAAPLLSVGGLAWWKANYDA